MARPGEVTAPPAFVRLAAHPLRWRLLTALAGGDHRVRELAALAGEPQNLVSYHLRLLRAAGLVTATRSSFDGRDTYYHLELGSCGAALAEAGAALHPALDRALRQGPAPEPALRQGAAPVPAAGPPSSPRAAVLFVCTGNSARSPIAEALLRHHAGGAVAVTSAGSHPRPSLHPDAVRVLRDEFGIDVAGRRPRHLDGLAGHRFDHVITLCDKAREVCPELPGRPRRAHWSIPDPASGDAGAAGGAAGSGYPRFRRTAADIDTRVRHLVPVLTGPGGETDRTD